MAEKTYDVTTKFMGTHPGQLVIEKTKDAEGMQTFEGCARLKMLKWLVYNIGYGTIVTNDDGSQKLEADLDSQFGNGKIHATFNISATGDITGDIPLLKGIVLTFEGHV